MTSPLTDKTGTPVEVHVTSDGKAYGIYFDGAQNPAGATYFFDKPSVSGGSDRIFYHTIVDDEYSGRGLAGVLVERALADTVKQGPTVVPMCPFVRSWIEKNQWNENLRRPTQDDVDFVAKNISGE